jgi:hypothetical protein
MLQLSYVLLFVRARKERRYTLLLQYEVPIKNPMHNQVSYIWRSNTDPVPYQRPPLWSSGQSSWLQIQRSGSDSRRYQIFWEVVGLERGPLSLLSTTEELLRRKSSGSGLESRKCGRSDPSRWPPGNLYPQKLALTSQTSGGRWVGLLLSRTQATEFSLFVPYQYLRRPYINKAILRWHPRHVLLSS